jgi:DNA invertase Pin-like site-specific DNA recombinase
MDGYVRVSRVAGREGDSYISPSVQRESIEKWASYKGVTIAAWHIDEDWSGGTHERPGLEAAVERAVSGEVDGTSLGRSTASVATRRAGCETFAAWRRPAPTSRS